MPSRKERLDKLAAHQRFELGALLVQPGRLVILNDMVEIHLTLRQMEVLVALADSNGEFVSKEDLLVDIWKNRDQSDNVVEKVISELRKALSYHLGGRNFIEIVSGSYRITAKVVGEDGRLTSGPSSLWCNRNPYVGLEAYSDAHTEVFCGRTRVTDELLSAMRKQIDNERRFVFVVGASGCGKTSLLHAGVLSKLRGRGVDGMKALSVAHCNLAVAQGGDVIELLASALVSWSLHERPVFPPQSASDLAQQLIQNPESIDSTVQHAFTGRPDRAVSQRPREHLLLVIDHAETLVASKTISQEERNDFSRMIDALCDAPRTLVVMLARSDFPTLIESMPDLAERQAGEGHVHVLGPSRGEIGEIIRQPAYISGLIFDFDAESRTYLDEALRDAAVEHPDALPLLQHTLHSLYESRSGNRMLTFAAYRAIGGLEGAIAHRAEQVFGQLPQATQESLGRVLSQLIEAQADQDIISARRSPFAMLRDEHARTLVDAFIDARLFVGGDHGGQRSFGVIHEALLRQWPRARDWAQDNRRLLQARTRLRASAKRWHDEGRQHDHLLNPGRPLAEALEVATAALPPLNAYEQEFLALSNKQRIRKARIRTGVIASLAVLSLASIVLASLALLSRSEAVRERDRSSDLTAFVIGELAEQLDVKADMTLIESVTSKMLSYCHDLNAVSAPNSELITCSRASRKLGEVRMDQSKLGEAQTLIERAVALSEQAIANAPTSKTALNEAGQAYAWLGKLRDRQNDLNGAKRAWQTFLKFSESLIQLDSNDPEGLMHKSYALRNLGYVEDMTGNQTLALGLFTQSESFNRKALKIKKNDPLLEYELTVTSSFISRIQAQTGKLRDAERGRAIQIESLQRLLKNNPTAKDWERQLANLLHFHADVALDLGELDLAEKSIAESIEHLTSLCNKEPENNEWAKFLAQAHLLASDIAKHKGKELESIGHLDSALNSIRIDSSSPTSWKRVRAAIMFKRAMASDSIDSGRKMDDAIQSLRDIVRTSKDRHSRMALAEALLLRNEKQVGLNDKNRHEEFIDEALRTIMAIENDSEDIKVIALRIRAETDKDKERQDCEKIRTLAGFGYINPDYERQISSRKKECSQI